jgi:hypothetical protein
MESIEALFKDIATKEEECDKLEQEAINIAYQIERARAEDKNGDKDLDTLWLSKATYALKCKRQRINHLNREVAREKKRVYHLREMQNERRFVAVAKTVIDDAQYKEIWEQVNNN